MLFRSADAAVVADADGEAVIGAVAAAEAAARPGATVAGVRRTLLKLPQ